MYKRLSDITQPPFFMRGFILAEPAAGEIQQEYHQQPKHIRKSQTEPEIPGPEKEERAFRDNVSAAISRGKEQDHGDEVDQVEVQDVIKERHFAENTDHA